MRPVAITSGASEPRGVRIEDLLGNDLSTCTFKTCLALAGEVPAPGDYETALPTFSQGAGSSTTNVAVVTVRVDAAAADAGVNCVQWVLLVDGPSTYALRAPEVISTV